MKAVKRMNNGGTSDGESRRVQRILRRAKKKAAKVHEKEARKEAKGKDVEVLGTKRVTTAAEPRMLTSKRETRKVYAKERDVINKADVKAAEVEAKEKEKGPRRRKVKPPKSGGGFRRKRGTGGPLRSTFRRIEERAAFRKSASGKAKKRGKRCGKECQRLIRQGKAGFARN